FRKLRPITELHGKDLFDIWYQCILCHITLWKEGVYHRDVSPPNLMWYWKDGKRIGVLNDYDLSSLADEPGPRGNERTGTVPFMALDLLTEKGQRGEVKHLYRHDLESFMWCFAWVSMCYENKALLPRGLRPFDEWVADAVTCFKEKLVFQNCMPVPACTHEDDLMWKFLAGCFLVLKKDADNRHYRRFQDLSDSEADQQPNADELDPDVFLSRFTRCKSWRLLSESK
ncbi:hypothetical protein P692DRAFT_20740747, partial [Suillus brevipes Sb2]